MFIPKPYSRSVFFLMAIIFCLLGRVSTAQFDTTGGRFIRPVFDSAFVIQDVVYAQGLNFQNQIQDLKMDVYQPFGDTMTQKPVIILAHGGGFIQGNKAEMANYCLRFAKMGYVTVAIQYRLGYTSISTVGLVEMVIRATQDMKNAVRYLRKTASDINPYSIHPDFIFAGGFSAGAITALHLAYMDQLEEIPAGQSIGSLDSLHNTGQIPGYDWKVKAILNIAGAVGDTNWIKPGDLPVISFHGTADATVPFVSGNFGLPFGPALSLFGSQSIFNRTQNLEIRSELRAFQGAGHDYSVNFPWAVDTTEKRITRFLLPFLTENVTNSAKDLSGNSYSIRMGQSGWILDSRVQNGTLEVLSLTGSKLADLRSSGADPFVVPYQNQAVVIRWTGTSGRHWVKILPQVSSPY
jgi:acetyl esterase/lipase